MANQGDTITENTTGQSIIAAIKIMKIYINPGIQVTDQTTILDSVETTVDSTPNNADKNAKVPAIYQGRTAATAEPFVDNDLETTTDKDAAIEFKFMPTHHHDTAPVDKPDGNQCLTSVENDAPTIAKKESESMNNGFNNATKSFRGDFEIIDLTDD